jgi:hypothetical protein
LSRRPSRMSSRGQGRFVRDCSHYVSLSFLKPRKQSSHAFILQPRFVSLFLLHTTLTHTHLFTGTKRDPAPPTDTQPLLEIADETLIGRYRVYECTYKCVYRVV